MKNPERGRVKSRLATAVGARKARTLYRNFILDMLSSLQEKGFPLIICFHPENALRDVQKTIGQTFRFQPQKGNDLGQRMKYCFRSAFSQGLNRVIAIGSDIPDLPANIVDDSFSALTSYDSVIGPSFDGGYYLIGFQRSRFLPDVFKGINWGTHEVAKETIDTLNRHHTTTYKLPRWNDIDTLEDLRRLYHENKDSPRCPRTIAYLRSIKLQSLEHT
jgi:rSAM/selenodomain-associated transferase 1